MATEIEFKWDANTPRAFYKMRGALERIGVQVSSATRWNITDVYVDTPARDFEKQKIAFRVRHANQNWEATFKTRTEIVRGKAVRREETCTLPGVKNVTQALEILQRKKIWKGLNLQNLFPLFTLKNRRETYWITYQKTHMELALDTCEILVCGRRVLFKEIELEYKSGTRKNFEELGAQLTQRSGLVRAQISKVKTALLLRAMWRANDSGCSRII